VERTALCLPASVRERVAAQLERHGYSLAGAFADCGELARALVDGVDVAIVAAQPRYLDRPLVDVADARGVRLVAMVEGEADRRYARALGLFEVVDLEASFDEIEASMARREAVAAGTSGAAAIAVPGGSVINGSVIAVWGPIGSPGRTTLAISIAAELAARGFSVVLADVDTHGGAIAPSLGLLDESPGFAAACRLAGNGVLDLAELDRIAELYSSARGSFRVLTGIGRPSRWPELSSERVAATIAACRTWADFTVLDTGASLENDEEISSDLFAPRRNAATISALLVADRVVAVGSADPVGLSRFLRAWVDVVDVVEPERLVVVVNRLRASAIGPAPLSQVVSTLDRFGGIHPSVVIPHDQSALDSAILTGRTVQDAAPKSPVTASVAELVGTHLLPAHLRPAAAPTRRGRRTMVTP
jgi:MinD-like ATPase involved in chromosome partitioning or flagellar assembly